MLVQCARRYYLRYYAGAGGWRENADADTRMAYCLRYLLTLELALGTELHERAREIAAAIRAGQPFPTAKVLRTRTRTAMNRLYARSDVAAILADPKRFPLRMEVFYGRGIDPERVVRLREKMDLCLEALCNSPLWPELTTCRKENILLVDRLTSCSIGDVTVYAAPDLVYHTDSGHVIVKWKTGHDPLVREQTALYGLFVRDGLGVPWDTGCLRVRLFRLDLATEEAWDISSADLAAAEARMHDSAAVMRSLLRDANANVPQPIEDFPLTTRQGQCPPCPFGGLCEDETRSFRC